MWWPSNTAKAAIHELKGPAQIIEYVLVLYSAITELDDLGHPAAAQNSYLYGVPS